MWSEDLGCLLLPRHSHEGHLDQLPNCLALLTPVSCSTLSQKFSNHPEIVDIKISKKVTTNPVG